MNPVIHKLVKGFNDFHDRYFSERKNLYKKLVEQGQKPKVAVIACADSRVDPAIVLQVEPGDIFAIRNVANLVPPYEEDDDKSYHGTSAALEFAVTQLGVEHIVVVGHAHCAGVKAMIDTQQGKPCNGRFITLWTSMAAKAYVRSLASDKNIKGDDLARSCEQQTVLLSLENLKTFPFIQDGISAKTLEIHGWYLDIELGEMSEYDVKTDAFRPLH